MATTHLTTAPTKSWLVPLCTIYSFTYAGALLLTYLPRYFESIGFSVAAIGLIFSVRSLLQSVATPVWATIADRLGAARRIVQLQCALGLLALLALPFSRAYPVIFLAVVVHGFTAQASTPLVDALTLREVGANRFGSVRAWGSAGYGTMALVAAAAGLYATHAGLAMLAPWLLLLTATGMLAAALCFPPIVVQLKSPNLRDSLRLLRRPVLWLVIPISAAHWLTQAPYNLFIVFLCEERHLGAWVPGMAVSIGVLGEIITFAAGASLLRAMRPYTLIVISIFATAIRWYITGTATTAPVLMAVQILHGLSFGGFYVAIMAILGEQIAPEIRATGQGLFYFLVFGLGSAIGNGISGYLLESNTAATLFQWAGFAEFAVLVCAFAAWPTIKRLESMPQTNSPN